MMINFTLCINVNPVELGAFVTAVISGVIAWQKRPKR